jgi:hypothetical protein
MMFGLMGNDLDLINQVLSLDVPQTCAQVPLASLGQSLLVVVVGSIMRTIFAFLSVFSLGSGMNWRECAFAAVTWLPRAAPTAALAPLYLDMARIASDKEQIATGITVALFVIAWLMPIQIVSMAILSILLTAPIGALLIKFTASHLLHNGGKVALAEDDKDGYNKRNTTSFDLDKGEE